ncbi:elongation of very long chain fatty acids protein F-like [Musca vetustissima]|uniref:elongation of very long chain fatty acids protein F-like n=1 Tax=Musca vetustissima TaxID=27455 RepID=UPI002AB73090|nr:elongation of very long chain fatty acids protein F-like [Musca vetustissima]
MLILKLIYWNLKSHFELAGNDPRMHHLFFVNSYRNVLLLIAAYIVFVKKIGPALMAKRRPFEIKRLIQLYNLGQILLNTYVFIGFMRHFLPHPAYDWFCMKIDSDDISPETMNLLHITHTCYLTKIFDVLDTIFFVMRKKNRQISFLHVYHHATMIWASFIYHVKFFGTAYTAIGHVNSFVHMLMYTYYFLSSLDTNLNLDAWKPRITEIQIIQFFYFSIKFGLAIINNTCGMSTGWLAVLFIQNLFMTLMFCNFYYKTYIAKSKKVKKMNDQ